MTQMTTAYSTPKWWKEAFVYQIYPASFKDSNGDGWGDVQGIISKLDYLKSLGVDVIWTSPIYKSPMADMGYDISDYTDIDPRYGTLADVDELIAELKKRDMKLMMDLVVNHTSDQHAWFKESRSSKNNAKRDWYIWQPPKTDADGKKSPPNNWGQLLGDARSAWTWDEASGEYYLSLFTPEQPDLNWENPVVREAVHDIMRFWLDKGVCGFRMDVINLISKVPGFPEADIAVKDSEFQPGDKFFANGPRLHEFLREMNAKVLQHYDCVTVGEMPFVNSEEEVLKLVNPDRKELNMIFNFAMVNVDEVEGGFHMATKEWKPSAIRRVLAKWYPAMIKGNGWSTAFLENHDQPRSVSKFASDMDEGRLREYSARMLSLFITSIGGTFFMYQGQELGMRNVPEEWDVSEYKDIEAVNYWKKMQALYSDQPDKLTHAKKLLNRKARDNSRTPVQWSKASPNAGFCPADVKPWMRVNSEDAAAGWNAEDMVANPFSIFHFYRIGMEERKKHGGLIIYGDFQIIGDDKDDDPVIAYTRIGEKEAFVIVLNFSGTETEWTIPTNVKVLGWVGGSYVPDIPQALEGTIRLRPYEGLLGTMSKEEITDYTKVWKDAPRGSAAPAS